MTRFLRNGRVTPQAMVSEAAARLGPRCSKRRVLAIQDTTVVRAGAGDYLHAVIAVDADDGALLGLIDGAFLKRTGGQRSTRRDRPIEEKESMRWLEGANRAAAACAGASSLVVIADREGDIYQAFARRPADTDLLVRVAQDRGLDEGGRLFDALDAMPEAGRISLALPAAPGRRARDVILAIRFGTRDLARPRNGRGQDDDPPKLSLQFVDIREPDPPPGQTGLHWRLMTSLGVANMQQAQEIATLYSRRWAIEQLFRTLKTKGFDIEGLLVEEQRAHDNLVMASLIAAVTIQQLVHARDGKSQGKSKLRPIEDAFEDEDKPLLAALSKSLEGSTQRQKNPHPKGSLAFASWVCARLGGWTGYYGKPGPIVILNGWMQFQAAKRGVKAMIDVL